MAARHHVSPSTIARTAGNEGLYKRKARKAPYIRQETIPKRLAWARDSVEIDWSAVVFTDEAAVEMGKKGGTTWTIRRKNEEYLPRHLVPTFRSTRQTLMIWGCIALGHKWPLLRLIPQQKKGEKKKRGLDRYDYVNLVLEDRLAGYMSEL